MNKWMIWKHPSSETCPAYFAKPVLTWLRPYRWFCQAFVKSWRVVAWHDLPKQSKLFSIKIVVIASLRFIRTLCDILNLTWEKCSKKTPTSWMISHDGICRCMTPHETLIGYQLTHVYVIQVFCQCTSFFIIDMFIIVCAGDISSRHWSSCNS